MALTTIYFPGNAKEAYRKCIVEQRHIKYFMTLGAARTPEIEIEPEPSPDKGWGKPGSYKWHCAQIAPLRTNNQVRQYVQELTGETITNRGTPTRVKSIAQKKIKEWIDAIQGE